MAKGTIGVTTDNIFPVIKKFLYSDHEIFLRELVSNAVDATQKLKTLASVGEFKGEMGTTNVEVKIDAEKGTLTISDRGVGMTAAEIAAMTTQEAAGHQITTDAALLEAGCSMQITGLRDVVAKAANNAR